MHMTPNEIITAAILITSSVLCLFLRLTSDDDRRHETREAERRHEARHDARAPRLRNVLDPFSWAATEAIVDAERERLASTGELRRLYQRPCPPAVSETGELRALAEAGDADTIRAIVDAWKTDHLEGEA
jgi:hypothetical protein